MFISLRILLMKNNKAYEKLIDKIQHRLIDLEQKINTLPDINLLNLPVIIFKSFSSSSQIKELDDELNQLRGKVKSTLDTYVRTNSREESIEGQKDTNNESSFNRGYLSKLMQLSEEINLLKNKLDKKSLQSFLDNKTEESVGRTTISKNSDDINWEELDINL